MPPAPAEAHDDGTLSSGNIPGAVSEQHTMSIPTCSGLDEQLDTHEANDKPPPAPKRYVYSKTIPSTGSVLQIAQAHGHPLGGELLPQADYKPHTKSGGHFGVEQAHFHAPILFFTHESTTLGIPLVDALSSRFVHLDGREDPMFERCGPSVSIRLNWPGYPSWSRQIPTRDFASPPRPITRAKLARHVAKTIQRFIADMTGCPMSDGAADRWRVGAGHITVDGLVLVGLQQVSMGSWQAHIRVMSK